MKVACVLTAVILLGLMAPAFGDQIISDWEVADDRDGWIHNHTNDGYAGPLGNGDSGSYVAWAEEDGNGYLYLYDVAAGRGDWAVAGPQFLGNWSLFIEAAITFDYRRLTYADGRARVRLYNGSAWAQWEADEPFGDLEWHSFTAPIVESEWSDPGMPWMDFLSNVTEVDVHFDLRSGREDSALDNFALNYIIPEPGAVFAVGMACLGSLTLLRRRSAR